MFKWAPWLYSIMFDKNWKFVKNGKKCKQWLVTFFKYAGSQKGHCYDAYQQLIRFVDYQHDPVSDTSLLSTLFFVSATKITLNLPILPVLRAIKISLSYTPARCCIGIPRNPDTLNGISGHLCMCCQHMRACMRVFRESTNYCPYRYLPLRRSQHCK